MCDVKWILVCNIRNKRQTRHESHMCNVHCMNSTAIMLDCDIPQKKRLKS